MKRAIAFQILLMVSALCSACFNPGKMVEINFKLQRGEAFLGEIEVEQIIVQEISNQKFETVENSNSSMRFTINENRNNTLKVDVLYEDLLMHIKNPLINIKYDSKSKNNPALETIKSIINKKITLLVNNKGEIQSIDGINPVLNSIIRNNALNPLVTSTVITFFNEQQLKNNLIYLFNYIPRKKFKAGDAWNTSHSIFLNDNKVKANNRWTLERINDDVLVLSLKAKVTGNSLSGTQEGSLEIDRETGWISTGNIKLNIPADNERNTIGLKSTIAFRFSKIK